MNPLIFILFVPFVFLTMTHNCTKETLKEYTIVEERKRKAGLFETRLLKNTAVTFSAIIHYNMYRVWSVNEEAARNPPEISGNPPWWFPAGSRIPYIPQFPSAIGWRKKM